jgi:hydrogenase maturation protease
MSGTAKPAVVVIGVGAVPRGDDGFGVAVLAALYDLPGLGGRVRLAACDGDPARLIELWDGFEHAIIVSTTRAGAERHGYVYRGELPRGEESPESDGFAPGDRRCGFATAVRLAESLNRLPRRLTYYTVRGRDFDLGERTSPPVAAVVAALAARIRREVLADDDRAQPTYPGGTTHRAAPALSAR